MPANARRSNPHSILRISALTLLLLAPFACRNTPAPAPPKRPPPSTQPIYKLNETQLDAVLADLAERQPDLAARVVTLARRSIGQPYRLGLLGEGGVEPYDPDPLYCLSASDCVTFVEQTYAMALSHDWPEFLDTLRRIRYRDGKIGMLSRNHFTEADWNINNDWLFDDITRTIANGKTAPLRQRVDRAAFFKKYGIGQDIPAQNFVSDFIPRKYIQGVLSGLRDADVAEIVRGTSAAPYVGHMGLIVHNAAGKVMFLHSGDPAVREVPLADYLSTHKNVIGMKFLRPRPQPRIVASSPADR